MASHLAEIDGLEKLTLLRYGRFGIFLEALTVCGVFLSSLYRYLTST